MSLRNKNREYGLKDLIKNALREDIGCGDITSELLIPKNKKIKAIVLLKEKAVIAGLGIAEKVFKSIDRKIKFKAKCLDGSLQDAGKILAVLEGSARNILLAERTALNFLTHLCGVASLVHSFVREVKPFKVKILDTRKTIPGLRNLQKYAVLLGGGYNHRIGLWDEVLIKDNHLAVARGFRRRASMGIRQLIEAVKEKKPKEIKAEIEVKNLRELKEALKARPDIIMLDNMKLSALKKAVRLRNGYYAIPRILLEVSGGVNLDNVRTIAKTGVDMISIGCLTHSVKAIDISLEISREKAS